MLNTVYSCNRLSLIIIIYLSCISNPNHSRSAGFVHSSIEGDQRDTAAVAVLSDARSDRQLVAVRARSNAREHLAYRFRENGIAAVENGDNASSRVAGGEPRGRLLDRDRESDRNLPAIVGDVIDAVTGVRHQRRSSAHGD